MPKTRSSLKICAVYNALQTEWLGNMNSFLLTRVEKHAAVSKDLLKYMSEGDFHNAYPDLYAITKICATISNTSSQCERTHIKVALVKSVIRSTTADERLKHLVLLNVAWDVTTKLGLSSIVDAFKRLVTSQVVD
jgi:hypothetical protein